MTRRITLLAAPLALSLLLLISACGGGSDSEGSSSTTHVGVWHWIETFTKATNSWGATDIIEGYEEEVMVTITETRFTMAIEAINDNGKTFTCQLSGPYSLEGDIMRGTIDSSNCPRYTAGVPFGWKVTMVDNDTLHLEDDEEILKLKRQE